MHADSLKQSFDLGFTNTTGNSQTTNLNGKYRARYSTIGLHHKKLHIKFSLAAYYAENRDVKSNEEYTSSLSLEQYIQYKWLGYFLFEWLRNPDFKNYNGKYDFSIGAGKRIYKTDSQNLKVKFGLGYTIEDYANDLPTKRYASLVENIEYTNRLNQLSLLYIKSKFWESFEDFSKNYEIGVIAGIKFNITKRLHIRFEEQVNYDNLPPQGSKKTDTKTIVSLGIRF